MAATEKNDFESDDFSEKGMHSLTEHGLVAQELEEQTVISTDTISIDQNELIKGRNVKSLTVKPDNKYRFERSIGMGGMKAVLQVWDKDTSRSIAMAVIPDCDDRPPSDIKRFIQEARITAMLEHPNIVPIHEIGVDKAGSPYFTMKFLRGRTLAEILRGLRNNEPEFVEKFDLQRMMRVYVKVCNAIAFAHSKDIIHLDIKPENIHVGDFGEVLVLDWGLAKYIGETEETYTPKAASPVEIPANEDKDFLTLDGVAKGTPGYMAPEQAAGENSKRDKRSDIYALGAILYSILTQQKPVQGNDVKKIMADTIQGNIVSPRKAAAETDSRYIPSALEAIAMKAMSVNPDDRYQTVRELREDIFAFMGGFAPKAEAASSLKKTVLFINRNSFKIYFAIAMILLLALIGTVLYMYFAGLLVFEISGD